MSELRGTLILGPLGQSWERTFEIDNEFRSPHFIDENTEAYGGNLRSSVSHKMVMTELSSSAFASRLLPTFKPSWEGALMTVSKMSRL